MKNFHKRGGGLLVFILLFRNLKAQNGIFWARIGCFDVYDNSVCGWSTIPHQYIRKLACQHRTKLVYKRSHSFNLLPDEFRWARRNRRTPHQSSKRAQTWPAGHRIDVSTKIDCLPGKKVLMWFGQLLLSEGYEGRSRRGIHWAKGSLF